MDVKKRIQIAISRATLRHPFFINTLMYLTLKSVRIGVGPMATDMYYRLYYDEDLIVKLNLSDDQLLAIVLHEILHNILLHFKRLRKYPQEIANIAGDLEINQALQDLGYNIRNGLFPQMFGLPPHKTAEEYAEMLLQNSQMEKVYSRGANEGKPFGGSSANGRKQEWEDDYDKSNSATQSEAETIAREVAEEKQIGDIPGYLKRILSTVAKPKVNWKRLLRVAVKKLVSEIEKGKFDYSRVRPSKKSYASDVVYPGTVKPKLSVGVLIDTSGSMSANELSSAVAEVLQIVKETKSTVHVFSGDTKIYSHSKIKGISGINKLELVGGGGTAMDVCMEQVASLKLKLNLFVVISDGYTDWPKENPFKVPVIVALTTSKTKNYVPEWVYKTVVIKEGDGE